MDETKINDLLEGIKQKNMDSFGELYYMLNTKIFAYVLSITKSKHLADDITQDVFLKIITVTEKYKTKKNPSGWIFRLTKNLVFDALRRQKREIPVETLPEKYEAVHNDIVQKMVLSQAVSKLKLTDRQIIVLHLVAGFSQKDIAGILKLPVTTVNWRYRVSLQKLAGFLGKEAM